MQVTVDQIRPEGLTLDAPIPEPLLAEALEGERSTGFHPEGATPLHATFQKVGSGVLLQGRFEVSVSCPCKRCLAEVALTVPVAFQLELVPEAQAKRGDGEDEDEQAEQGGSFDFDEAEVEPFDGRTIQLDPILREQVLLALPMDATCREDCKGLCGVCGKNLNEGPCGCRTEHVDPRLAALAEIKSKLSKSKE